MPFAYVRITRIAPHFPIGFKPLFVFPFQSSLFFLPLPTSRQRQGRPAHISLFLPSLHESLDKKTSEEHSNIKTSDFLVLKMVDWMETEKAERNGIQRKMYPWGKR